MGGSKTKTTTNQQQTASTTLPAWMTDAGQTNYNNAASWMAANPVTSYTGQMTAGNSANQTAASNLAANSTGVGQSELNQSNAYAAQATNGTVPTVSSGTFDASTAAKYMSPYQQKVQQDTLNTMDLQDKADQATLADQTQAAGAYGGARQALMSSELTKNQELAKQNYVDQSNQDAYTNAQSQFNTENAANMQAQTTNASNQQSILDRLLSAAGLSSSNATTAGNLNTQAIGNLTGTGAVDQNTANAADSAAYQDYLRTQTTPLDEYNTLASILSGTPKNVTTSGTSNGTSTTQQSSSLLNSLMGLGSLGVSAYSAGMFSDRRLKRDIGLIERRGDGLGIYRYRYLWDDADADPRIGVMADEVADIIPAALGPRIGGYATVDYSKLGGF